MSTDESHTTTSSGRSLSVGPEGARDTVPAARSGPEPEKVRRLRLVVDAAKKELLLLLLVTVVVEVRVP